MPEFKTDVIDDAAQARADAAELDKARSVAAKILGPAFRADGLSALEIKTKIAAKAFPGLSLAGKPADYVQGLFDKTVADLGRAPALSLRAGLRPLPGDNTTTAARTSADARRELYERAENAWRDPESKGE